MAWETEGGAREGESRDPGQRWGLQTTEGTGVGTGPEYRVQRTRLMGSGQTFGAGSLAPLKHNRFPGGGVPSCHLMSRVPADDPVGQGGLTAQGAPVLLQEKTPLGQVAQGLLPPPLPSTEELARRSLSLAV